MQAEKEKGNRMETMPMGALAAAMSSLLSMVREVVFGVGLVLLLPRIFGLDGVLYSMPASDLLTFVISLVLILKIMKDLKAGRL